MTTIKIKATTNWLLLLGIILVGTNLRAPITSVGPLINLIQVDFSLSNSIAGLVTTIPILCFALVSPWVPKLAQRLGLEQVILCSLALLTVGIWVRSHFGSNGLFLGTILIGCGIAFSNVLLPSLIKREFPKQIGLITGIYSVAMNSAGAIASGLSFPLANNHGLGWSKTLQLVTILSLLSFFIWLPQTLTKNKKVSLVHQQSETSTNLLKSPIAWYVSCFMGLQSLIFYSLIAWLPAILATRDIATNQSGWLLSLLQLALLPVSFLVAIIAGRLADQRWLAIIGSGSMIIGLVGLLIGSSRLLPGWIILIGIGAGFCYSLSMIFFSSRTNTITDAAKLSGMAQAIGYTLAACGPLFLGLFHDLTASWDFPLLLLIIMACLLLLCGVGAGKEGVITSKK